MNYSKIKISLASPEIIKKWSYGEVLKPETINYRTLRPEKDGLFCERIFGATKDWECFCGKYKSIRYRGVVCDRCGVEITHSKVRRERTGHIDLACPVAHIWFYKAVPSRIGLLLDLSIVSLKSIIYYEKYIVTDPGEVPDLKALDLLKEDEYYELKAKYPNHFQVGIGAEIIQQMLANVDIEAEIMAIREKISVSRSLDRRKMVRLELLEDFMNSANRPEWMIINSIPVIPPELRPMVQLDGGRFATSDLNDLYRRLINRNNRLKKLIALKAPDVILKNEKRMLQESVDALLDNSRRKRAVSGVGNRPLKSLSDILKGKQGRFRQNLLGKRVDYSARSVIVVGPELKLHQCGLPKKIALEIFKPFVINKLIDKQIVYNIKSAKRLIASEYPEVWDILEETVQGHPVILNRAPTLHRLGMQAFEPVLTDKKAIRLHPLVCSAYNADFDGDQMAVHLPLSPDAQIEAWLLMLSALNLFDPANGKPIVVPTQDIILGTFNLTSLTENGRGEGKRFFSREEAIKSYELDLVDIQAKIKLHENGEIIDTSVGRILFSQVLPKDFPIIDNVVDDKSLAMIIHDVYKKCGNYKASIMLDKIKELGFHYSTIFANTISVEDILIPNQKDEIVKNAEMKVKENNNDYRKGVITEEERYQKNISLWTYANDQITQYLMDDLKQDQKGHNSLYIMATSGARGSKQQIRQLAGMRGLMAKPSGEIIDMPIISNFKEGLTVLEYFISTHGARKGLSDTALKTADAGYLTRKLVDIAQDVAITSENCGTIYGIEIFPIKSGDEIIEKLSERVLGRFTADKVLNPYNGEVILNADELVTEEVANQIDEYEIEKVKIRTVVTCGANRGICQKCYGLNLCNGLLVDIGEVVGIIASQSIGQPGTQLTMRTFHIGGTASSEVRDPYLRMPSPSILVELPENLIRNRENNLVAPRRSYIKIATVFETFNLKKLKKAKVANGERVQLGQVIASDKKDNKVTVSKAGYVFFAKDKSTLFHTGTPFQHLVEVGAVFEKEDFEFIDKDETIYVFDTITEPILAEIAGTVTYSDVYVNKTLREEIDELTGVTNRRIITAKDDNLHPKLIVVPMKKGADPIATDLPVGSNLLVSDGQKVEPGDILSGRIRSLQRTTDITGGLPRVQELFEARNPVNTAVVSEIDGIVEVGETIKGKRIVNVKNNRTDVTVKHIVPIGKALVVRTGDEVKVGDMLSEGIISPHDVLRVHGEVELYRFILRNIQEVYKRQGVNINDKHIGVIVRQMLRKVEVVDPGDTSCIKGQLVDKFRIYKQNESVLKEGGQPAVVKSVLLGLTKASLNTESFISSAAFQETTKVLTNTAIKNSSDELKGLKENIIIGKRIPAGTGDIHYEDVSVYKDIPGDLQHFLEVNE
ncbi:DNA-directed RNA polymerase subunit beta' [Spirochaetota bacterium]|nr:DNA-directed RNA polymerase subunit beta' [Spirochaetota bacterium]